MLRSKVINVPLYNLTVCFIESDSDKEINKKYDLDINELIYGLTIPHHIKYKKEKNKGKCIFIILNPKYKFKDQKFSMGTIAHECFHAAGFIFREVGIDASHENDEAKAYFLAYLVDEVIKFLDIKIKF